MSISEQLKKKRIELQMSQEVAADKAGISRRTLAYYETGERIPNAENLLILCNLYGLNVNELIDKDINEKDKVVADSDGKNNAVLTKIDRYLQFQQDKRDNFRKGAFYTALIISIITTLTLIVLITLKFVLMSSYGYNISEATASMWTSLLNAMITFVNDPNVQGFPVLSVTIFSAMVIGWSIYIISRKVRKNND